MIPKSHSEFVPCDTEESEFLDLVDFGDVSFSVETVIRHIKEDPYIHLFRPVKRDPYIYL